MSTSVNNIINTASSAASTNNNITQAQQGLNANYQEFLRILTTELQNQDPTSPIDPTQMVGQLAQLSQVEQQVQTNALLQQMTAAFSASQTSNAVSYIGKQIDAGGSPAQTELAGGQATLVYTLPAGVSSANVTITNSAGQPVFSGPGTTIAGRNQVIWDGTNSTTGVAVPSGTYNFTVAAADSSGNALTATAVTTGVVTAVDTQNGTTSLSFGGTMSVPLATVQAVYNPGTNPGS